MFHKCLNLLRFTFQGKLPLKLRFRRWQRHPETCPSDTDFIQTASQLFLGHKLDLENPQTFVEKINWLKLNYRKKIFNTMADKATAKKFTAEIIGDQYLIPLYGIWEHFDDIDFDQLPPSFVLKCNHDSGTIMVVKDKNNFDRAAAKKFFETRLKRNYYYLYREWQYRDIPPRIIAEAYLSEIDAGDCCELKAMCFNGKVAFVTAYHGKTHGKLSEQRSDNFAPTGERLPFYIGETPSIPNFQIPTCWNEMLTLSEKLAPFAPVLRVDWYVIHNRLYLGELTFHDAAGFMAPTPEEWNQKFGAQIQLPAPCREDLT